MRAKILVSWMFAFILGCFTAVALADYGMNTLYFAVVVGILAFLFLGNKYFFAAVFGFAIFLVSVWHFQSVSSTLISTNQALSKGKNEARLMVNDLPQTSLHGLKISLVSIEEPNYKINGYFPDGTDLKYGQVIDTQIKVKEYTDVNRWRLIDAGVAGESSVNSYMVTGKASGMYVTVKGLLLQMRQLFNSSISRAFPAAEAGLASGIVLGEKAMVSPEMTRMLQASGTTHIIALSGYNITVILGLFIIFRRRLSRLANFLYPFAFVLLFVIMTGAAASLVRAAIMGMMPLVARLFGRESNNFVAILFSATIMSVFNPFLPLYDIGFQLSFMAIVGVIYLTPLISRWLSIFGEIFSGTLAETLGAQLATFPVISYYFGIVSVVAPLTNLIILGLLPTCMALVFAVGTLGIIWQPIASLVAVPTYFLLHFVNSVISWSGSLGWASTNIKIENPWWMLIFYLLLFDLWLVFHKGGRERPTE